MGGTHHHSGTVVYSTNNSIPVWKVVTLTTFWTERGEWYHQPVLILSHLVSLFNTACLYVPWQPTEFFMHILVLLHPTQFFFYVCCLCRYEGHCIVAKTIWEKPIDWCKSENLTGPCQASACIHLTKNLQMWIWGREELEWSCQWHWKLLWGIHESDLQSCNKTVQSSFSEIFWHEQRLQDSTIM